jgi:hypothetical protein
LTCQSVRVFPQNGTQLEEEEAHWHLDLPRQQKITRSGLLFLFRLARRLFWEVFRRVAWCRISS